MYLGEYHSCQSGLGLCIIGLCCFRGVVVWYQSVRSRIGGGLVSQMYGERCRLGNYDNLNFRVFYCGRASLGGVVIGYLRNGKSGEWVQIFWE